MREFLNQILLGDCVAKMQQLPDGSIVLTVTSPPYDKIRKYGGHPFDFEAIAKELWRITAQGGVVVWVVQDQVVNGSFTGTKYKQALHFMGLGFTLLNDLTLTTVNTRFCQTIRYAHSSHTAFVLSKGRPRAVNLLRDKRNISAGKFKKDWTARSEDGKLRRGRYGKHIPPFGLRSDVWTYQVGGIHTTKDEISHPDPMAEKMAEDLILSFSRPGDVVFDPMCGSGTTCKAALLNHRSYLGMEIHEPYWKEAVDRLANAQEEYKRRLDEDLNPKIIVPSIVLPHRNGDVFQVPSIITSNRATATIKHGDVLKVLKDLDDNSFDGAFGDPPYGLKFMGKKWDNAIPPAEAWKELLRVCKPGATLLAFGHARTHHRLATNIECAGWNIMDTMFWLYDTVRHKGRDFSKDIDRIHGAQRAKVCYPARNVGTFSGNSDSRPWVERSQLNGFHEADGPIPVTPQAKRWLGYSTALMPTYDAIVVAQKPREGSYAENALKWNVAGLNIGACCSLDGKIPANILLDEHAAVLLDKQRSISNHGSFRKQTAYDSRFIFCRKVSDHERNAGLEGLPLRQSDHRLKSIMGYFTEKGSRAQENHHFAVKPLALCRHLATLILPPERDTPRKLIVPYAGTGSEMIGSAQVGWEEVLGIELDSEYIEIAKGRIAHWVGGAE
jgi:site-specific DNA-methyltransferase (adenine-specific)